MRFFAAAITCFGVAASYAQAPEVPRKMQFAGMTLTIRDDARQEIQKDVDALTQHSRYYILKVERAKTYFPIIEKIFEEERVPDDFKYLVLQESALVPDAVSASNAVGFWQFKDFTALEMGLRVDKDIDERMNLVSATRGAARYLKQSNVYFNNWLYALQSYQMGAGGVKRSVGDLQNGARHMDITPETYWYVKKFLAHKVAFEDVSHGDARMKVVTYQPKRSQSLKEIAAEVSAEEAVLKEYNKWLKTEQVPTDKPYTVLIPVGQLDGDFNKLVLSSTKASKAGPLVSKKEKEEENEKINGIPSIRSKPGETVATLAARAQLSLTAFLKYNDIAIDHVMDPGSVYLLGKKKNKGSEAYHKVKPGDDLWSISQQYGVRIRKLMKYNRLGENQRPAIGSMVWLSSVKPKEGSSATVPERENVAKLNESETFDWYTKSTKTIEAIPVVDAPIKMDSPSHDTVQERSEVSNTSTTLPSAGTVGQIIVHEVRSSDTLFSIARQFGVTIKDLMDWNNKKDLAVTVGEKLKIIQK